jgi:hypothetical protein
LAKFSDIKGDHWCPDCVEPKTQRKLRHILESLLDLSAKINYLGFDWLRNPRTDYLLEIDIWFPDIKLAIEYDGKQHFMPNAFFGGEEELKDTQLRDQSKNELIAKHSEITHFLRFNYQDRLTKALVLERLQKAGVL